MKTALFTGSFDPFTIGHKDIVERFLPLFDRIVIGIGVNERKACMLTAEERVAHIERVFCDNPKVKVVTYSDLTVSLAKREQADYIIKGVRSVKDFEYEREQADINRQLSGIETIILPASPQLAHISSSMARELKHFGQDISNLLP